MGECKELQPYCGGQKPFPVLEEKFECQFDWNRIQKPGTFFLLRSRMYTPIEELPPCDLRIFLATKKDRSESMHCCLLSSCMSFFVVLYFVTSFIFCDLVFCGFFYCEFHGGQNICQHDVSRTRGLYVYSRSSRIAFRLSGFCLPFLKPFYAVPLSIGPKNKHVLFGTKMIALLLGSMVFCMVMQNMWICCVCWV